MAFIGVENTAKSMQVYSIQSFDPKRMYLTSPNETFKPSLPK